MLMLLLQYRCAFFALGFRFMTITFLVLSAAVEAYYWALVLEMRDFSALQFKYQSKILRRLGFHKLAHAVTAPFSRT